MIKSLKYMLIFPLLVSLPLVFVLRHELSFCAWENATQSNDTHVLNHDTGKSYAMIQEAIDASETLDGHQILVSPGIYYEHVTVNKSVSLIGEDKETTIIHGSDSGTIVYVTADHVEIRNFTIQNGTFGLWLLESQNSRVIDNRIQHCYRGIRLYHSPNSEILSNTVSNCESFGFSLDSSGNSTLRNNKMIGNKYNFGVDGGALSDFLNDIDVSNTVNGKPIRYLLNQHDVTVDSSTFPDLGYLAIVNSTNVRLQNLVVQDNVHGIHLAFASNSTIRSVTARNNFHGIHVTHSRNVSANENEAHDNFDYGIRFLHSPHSLIAGNNVDNNGWSSIGLIQSQNSTIDGNNASFSFYNLHIVYSNNSLITRNTALREPGGYSIAVYYSHNNTIYHNMFDNSLLYVETKDNKLFVPRNSWDNGFEGNYWSSYLGFDDDEDGILNSPYALAENNVDNYPLKGKFSDFTVVVRGTLYKIAVISNSSISEFRFDADEKTISFRTANENGTEGFSRIAVPKELIQSLSGGDLDFTINGKKPTLKREWSSVSHTYWYFSYIHSFSESVIDPFLVVAAVLLLGGFLSVLFVAWKRRERLRLEESARVS